MILIISSAEDISTDFVIDWLHYYGVPYHRINFFDLLDTKYPTSLCYCIENNQLSINDSIIKLDEVNAVWLRKLGSYKKSAFYKEGQTLIRQDILSYQVNEFASFVMTVIKNINPKSYWITHYSHIGQTKWNVLREAINVGLKVPETNILNTKSEITRIKSTFSIINKTLQEPYFFSEKNHFYTMYTKEIDGKTLEYLPFSFLPSVVQRKIEKEYELRVFFLDEEFYPMAIFSQKDPTTQVDFRNYNREKPNRYVPYQLPTDLQGRLLALMQKIGLNCGSIDMIKEQNGDYIFLEVNPNGQFGMVDFPCNYNLHKLVAEKLISEDKKRNTNGK